MIIWKKMAAVLVPSTRYFKRVRTSVEKRIPDIYPVELQRNKANTSQKETSFLNLKLVRTPLNVLRHAHF